MRRAQIELLIVEINQQVFQTGVFIFWLSQYGTVERNVFKNSRSIFAVQFLSIGFFQIFQRNINQFPNIGLISAFKKCFEMTVGRNNKPFMLHGPFGPLCIAFVFFQILFHFVIMHIAQILYKKHGEYIILVHTRINTSSECIASFPNCVVNVLLCYVCH
ncbi:hypothetical protein SDC9_66726 [bioreactor metagenome]|uniref:Transmembrane protein n=1 Tax=bioreactor metagenome TaxID=1076179 RepID=A0A644XWI9_9ZZZZ